MKQLACLVLLPLFLGACLGAHNAQTAPSSAAPSVLISETVALVTVDEDGPHAFCTGTWISEFQILTAGHCVQDENDDNVQELEYITNDAPKFARAARLVMADHVHDLALLEAVDPPSHPQAELGPPPAVGDSVSMCGHVLGLEWSYMRGLVSAVHDDQTGPFDRPIRSLQIDIDGGPGDSGSAVFDDRGRLVGVLSWQFRRVPSVMFAIHRDVISEFLKR